MGGYEGGVGGWCYHAIAIRVNYNLKKNMGKWLHSGTSTAFLLVAIPEHQPPFKG